MPPKETSSPSWNISKSYFAAASGTTSSRSSSASWAETDLHVYMNGAAENAPLFIAAFYDACETLKANNPEFYTPDATMINAVLLKYGVQFEIRPPNLRHASNHDSSARQTDVT